MAEHTERAEDGMQAATGEAMEGSGGTTTKGGEVFVPPPISVVPEPWHGPHPSSTRINWI
jgi:hypothetical protein